MREGNTTNEQEEKGLFYLKKTVRREGRKERGNELKLKCLCRNYSE